MKLKVKIIHIIIFITSAISIITLATALFIHFAITPNVDKSYVRKNTDIITSKTTIYSYKNMKTYDPQTNKLISIKYNWDGQDEDTFMIENGRCNVYYNHNGNYKENTLYACKKYLITYIKNTDSMKDWTYNKKYFILDKNGENIKGEKFNCKEKLNSAINEFTKSVNKEINENNRIKITGFIIMLVVVLPVFLSTCIFIFKTCIRGENIQ